MDNSQFSQGKKAKAARRWRATNALKKRFDGPLKEYIKIRYSDIYTEYAEFYKLLDKKYPGTRDLSKTPMFKKWIKRVRKSSQDQQTQTSPVINQTHQQQESRPDILSVAIQQTLSEDIPNTVMEQILPEGIPEQVSASLQHYLPEVNRENDEILPGENIEDIINELEQNEAVRNILNPLVDEMIDRYNVHITNDNDEGIELNFMDEIDLQPFDYNLEVDF